MRSSVWWERAREADLLGNDSRTMNKSVRKQKELFEWLDALDLPHYFQNFVENGYEDLEICTEIGDSDLHAIGVSDIHERLSLLSAVRNLRHVPTQKELTLRHNNNYSDINYSRGRPETSGPVYDPYLDEEPFYESVSPVPQIDSLYCCDVSPNRCNNELFLRSRLRNQLARDNIDLSLVVEEVRLRGLAAQYAAHWASSSCGNGGWSGGNSEFQPPSPSDLFLQQELLFQQLRALWLEQRQKSSAQAMESSEGAPGENLANGSRQLVNNANNGVSCGAKGKGRSPEHHHQYLQHVIISQMNHGERDQIYTPGIYLPSSCLRDKDDIYDYAPPLTRNYTSPAKRSTLSAIQLKKSKSNLNSYGRKRGNSPGRRSFNISTIRSSSKSSYAVSSSQSCANILSPHSTSIAQFDTEPSPQHSISKPGCRTLANLSKLGKRLGGLGRFFRTLKIQGGSQVGDCRNDHSEPPIHLTHSQSQGFLQSYPTPLSASNKSKTLEVLPSNEKIIETINRLKYEELQKRKERIAQEHQMILKELKVSLSPNSNSTSDGPSSVFYVSPNSNVTSSDYMFEEDGKVELHNYDDPPYEIEEMRDRDSLEDPPKSRKPKRNDESGGRKRRSSSGGNLWQLFSNSPPKNFPYRGNEEQNTRADSPHGSERIRTSSRTSSSSESFSDGFPRSLLRKFNKPKIPSSEDLVFPSSSSFSGRDKESRGSQTEQNEQQSPEDSPGKTLLGRVKDFHRNTFSSSHRKRCTSNNGSSSDLYSQQHGEGEVGKKAAAHDVFSPNSSEEELASLPSDRQGSVGDPSDYNGPFVGKAVAIVDCTPSAYDHRALRYKKGDVIEIISKKPTGLWRGKVGNTIGDFKFINVQVLPEELPYCGGGEDGRRRRLKNQMVSPWEMEQRAVMNDSGPDKEQEPLSRTPQFESYKREEKRRSGSLKKNLPSSLRDLLHRFNLEEHISVFILHGFESLDLFKELEEEDLDRLAIMNPSDRHKILAAVELLRDLDSPPGSHRASQFSRFPRDSGVFVKCEDEGPEELILSPLNLQNDSRLLPGDERREKTMRNSFGGNSASYPNNYQQERKEKGKSNGQMKLDEFVEVRQRFLQARSMFEKVNSGPENSKGQSASTPNKFLYCEKSSDSGISTGSPPPLRI